MAPPAEATQPVDVDVQRDEGVTIRWEDGHVSRFDLEDLRVNCTCAECRGLRDRGERAWPKPSSPRPLRLESADLVGAWGLNLAWNDGHATGIYTWETLRHWN